MGPSPHLCPSVVFPRSVRPRKWAIYSGHSVAEGLQNVGRGPCRSNCLGDCFRHGGPRCYRKTKHSSATSRTPSPECWCSHDLYTFENELYTQVSSWWLGPSASQSHECSEALAQSTSREERGLPSCDGGPLFIKIKSEGKRKRPVGPSRQGRGD